MFRVLYALKGVCLTYLRRVRGLLKYIIDYKILLFSILYILFTFLAFKVLRNMSREGTMGLVFISFSLSSFFLLSFLLLRNISKDADGLNSSENTVHKYVHFFGLGIFVCSIVILVTARTLPILEKERVIEEDMASFTNEYVFFEAYMAEEADKKYRNQHIKLKQLQDISVNGQILDKNHGFILTRVDNYENFSIGQVCKFKGTLIEPENLSDFDYKAYLRNQRIFFILDNPTYACFNVGERRAGNSIRNFLSDLKENIVSKIDEELHEPHSSLLAGILFGKKRRMERDFQENIRVAGVSHVITASGYNITILIIMVNRMLFFLPKKAKVMSCMILIWCFAMFAGLGNSIIRACIMNTLSLVAVLFGRDNRIHISLPFASAVFVFLDPLIVLNVGFLLSISAILGLVYISPILAGLKEKFTKKFKFVDNYIFPTLSCTIGTLPVSILTFKTFTVWSVPVNAFVLPVVESTMLWGVLSLLFTNIHNPLSKFFFTIVTLQLKYLEYIVNRVGDMGFGSWEITENIAVIVAIGVLLLILLSVIYLYPIDNEKYNYYLKNN